MAATKERLTIFPSQANLTFMKVKTESAIRGLGLLRKKRDSLQFRLREIAATAQEQKSLMPTYMRQGIFYLNRAKFHGVELYPISLQGGTKAEITVKITKNVVAGVVLPGFKMETDSDGSSFPLAGLAKGGQSLLNIRLEFQKIVKTFLELASLLYSEKALKEAVAKINIRTNALEYIVIPRFKRTVSYVRDELEELAREEFYRLKKAQASHIKQRIAKAEEQIDFNHRYKSSIKSISNMNWAGLVDFGSDHVLF